MKTKSAFVRPQIRLIGRADICGFLDSLNSVIIFKLSNGVIFSSVIVELY